jgi:pimeloyl-ACP methyl ester carboxylesterase
MSMGINSIVVSAHGVMTLGEWQENVVTPSFAGIDGLEHKAHKYGWFNVVKIFFPWSRRKQVRRFSLLYDSLCSNNAIRPSVIAHSFGTYIVTTALRRHRPIKFDRVILCGSIVSRDYPWHELLGKKVTAVRNELASEDRVVRMFRWRMLRWLVPGAGPSGVDGFENSPSLVRNVPSNYTHSEHFLLLKYCNRYWRPFVRGVEDFTNLCHACSRQEAGAWKQFERDYTPDIRKAVTLIFAGKDDAARSTITDMIVISVAREGCQGVYGAEKLALTICLEIKDADEKRKSEL